MSATPLPPLAQVTYAAKPYVMKLMKNYDEKFKAMQSGLAIRPITSEEARHPRP